MFNAEKCDLCGDCLVLCPYVDYDREEAVEQFRLLMEDETPKILSECVTCAGCNEFCEKGANPFDLILARQEQTGIPHIPEENTKIFRGLADVRSEIIPGNADKPALSLCSVGEIIPGLFDGPMFEGMTILKGGDYFCRLGYIHMGLETPVRENTEKFVENLAASGAEEIVFYHDDCYALLALKAYEYGIDVPFKPIHIIEYLLERVKNRKNNITPLGMKIAYQRPCASRCTPQKDECLDELFRMIGVERVAREYDRINALCCGAPLMPRDRERAKALKKRNVADAVSHGADAFVYLCPLCTLNLRKIASVEGLENHHVIELVKRAVHD
ncbi:MAG: (Fe-S)-binding protein [Actinobacteria bacterium]|nr:(Fe-S)-binding protein [Actinomycetota bacterium]